jgi:predicted Zn-dependent protease
MRGVLGVGIVFSFLVAGVTHAATQDSKMVLFLSSPEVDTELSRTCFGFVKNNVRGQLRRDLTLLRSAGFGPEEQLRVFSAMRSDGDALVVVLVNVATNSAPVVTYSEKRGSAVVNIAMLDAAEEITEQGRVARIERAAMYAVGRLVGMPACLNPYCALSEYVHVQKNKVLGRNYCPHCSDRVAAGLKAVGVVGPVSRRGDSPSAK